MLDMVLLTNQFLNIAILIVVAGIAALIPAVYYYLWKWVQNTYRELPEDIRASLEAAALIGARYAEQLSLSPTIENVKQLGAKKMIAATDKAIALLEAQGYDIDDATRDAVIALIENVILVGLEQPEAALLESMIKRGVTPPDDQS